MANIDSRVIRNGSHFFGVEPCISHDELEQALEMGFGYADKLHEAGLQVVALGNIGERTFLDALVTTATITGASYESLLTESDNGPTIAQRAAHIHSFVDPF